MKYEPFTCLRKYFSGMQKMQRVGLKMQGLGLKMQDGGLEMYLLV
jgi:hypothetical protein